MSSDDVMLSFSCLHRISFSRFYNSWCRLCHMNSSYWRFLFHHYLSHDCLKTEYFIWYSMAGLGNQISASSLWVCCFYLCGWGLLWINSIKHVFSVMYGPWSASGFTLWPVELTETFLMPGLGESVLKGLCICTGKSSSHLVRTFTIVFTLTSSCLCRVKSSSRSEILGPFGSFQSLSGLYMWLWRLSGTC